MPFSGGVFSRLYNWVSDRLAAVNITDTRMDAEFDGIAAALSMCVLKDGTQTILSDIPFNGHKVTGIGNATNATDALNQQAADGRYSQLGAANAYTGAQIITSNDPNALTVGPTGALNPMLRIYAAIVGAVQGVQLAGLGPGLGFGMGVISPGANEDFYIDSKGTGRLILNGGQGVGQVIAVRPLLANDTTPSTTPTTGALVVGGGVGVAGNVNAAGNVTGANVAASNNVNGVNGGFTGSMTVLGAMSVGGNMSGVNINLSAFLSSLGITTRAGLGALDGNSFTIGWTGVATLWINGVSIGQIWTAGTDGINSGLDADVVRGQAFSAIGAALFSIASAQAARDQIEALQFAGQWSLGVTYRKGHMVKYRNVYDNVAISRINGNVNNFPGDGASTAQWDNLTATLVTQTGNGGGAGGP